MEIKCYRGKKEALEWILDRELYSGRARNLPEGSGANFVLKASLLL
jgi:hypothetical protein